MIRILTICVLLVSITISSNAIRAQGEERHEETLVLQPDLLALLRAEMREITTGVQKIPVAIAQADWETLAQTGKLIQSSYIMAKALTKEQAEALESGLPARFKQIDSEFHARAGKLVHAAEARDFELSSHHYSRLIESCAQCHSLYAQARFPAFGPTEAHGHQH
jgi:cytochrome c556